MKAKFLIPLALFGVLVAFLAVGLTRDPHEIPSPFINKPAPPFKVAQLIKADDAFSPADLKGQVWMLNVWASWCVACRSEHPLLVQMPAPVYGQMQSDPGLPRLTDKDE